MPKTLILVFPLSCIFLRYWVNTFIPALAVWASSSGWMSLQALTSRQCPCLADSFSATFPHFCLFILPPKIVIQIFNCLDYCNTRLDPAMKLVFLAHCFEHASSLYPPYHQFPSSLTVIFHSFPGHHLSFTVKTSVPAPAGSPPTLSPTIARMFSFATSTYVLLVLEEAPRRHPRCFFLISETFLSNLFHSDTCNQLRTA